LRRFIATTLPARTGVTGSVPLPGWDPQYDFPRSTEASLTVEVDPPSGYSLTANNDTMGERGAYYVHNFPTHSARAKRIDALLNTGTKFSTADFEAMQLDLKDLRATAVLPDLLTILGSSEDANVRAAHAILEQWDGCADPDSAGACLFYPFQDRQWPRRFMRRILRDKMINAIPAGAPGLNRFDISQFMAADSPWQQHRREMAEEITGTMATVYTDVVQQLGDDPQSWRWGDLHQIRFRHSLAKYDTWSHMAVGPDPIGGSPTTLGMAMHMGPGPGRAKSADIPCMVYHGPAYRLVVDLADPDHARFVIAGGNGGRPDSPYVTNQYPAWLQGEYFTVPLRREALQADLVWEVSG
jgi:penicillin amidase